MLTTSLDGTCTVRRLIFIVQNQPLSYTSLSDLGCAVRHAANQKLEIKHGDQSETREGVASLRVNFPSLWNAALAWELTLFPPGQGAEWGRTGGRRWRKELVFTRTMVSLFIAAHLILPTTSGLVVKSTESGGSFQASSYDSCMALGNSLCLLICSLVIKEDIMVPPHSVAVKVERHCTWWAAS